MSIISHGGKDYDAPAYSVQDDSSATSLDSSKVPTGGTVQSVYGDPDTYMIKGTDYVTAGKKANTTLGVNATAEGLDTTASSAQAHAEGKNTVASGSYSHAEGEGSTASGQNAHAEGWYTTAGPGCHAEGSNSTASSSYSHAEGVATTASNEGAHAEGYSSSASGQGSHAEGRAYARADYSHAEGLFSEVKATAAQAHAEGRSTLASSESQHVQGKYNVEDANGIYAHIVGNGTNSSNRSNAHTLDWSGNAWFAGDVTDGSGNVLSDKADTADISGAKSISGNPIIIEDSANSYAEEVIANIEPIQDLHGYDYPWVGGAGKNLLNYDAWKTVNLVNCTAVWENNGVTLTAIGNDSYTSANFPDDAKVPISEGETVTLSWESNNNLSGYVYIFPNGGTTGMEVVNNNSSKSVSYTATSGITFVTFRFGVSTNGETISYKNIQLEKNSTHTSYEPYSNICPISGLDSVEVKRIGKNLLPMTVDGIKAGNTSGSWNGNVYTISGVIFTVQTDSDNNVVGIKTNGTANAQIIFNLGNTPNSGNYILNGCPAGGNITSGYSIYVTTIYVYDIGSGTNVSLSGTSYSVSILIRNGADVSNKIFYPMIRLSTEADSTFEPYQSETHTTSFPQTTYGGTLNVQTGELVVDRIYKAFNGGETWYTDSRWPLSYYTVWANDSKYISPTITGFGNYIQCNKYHGVAKQVDNIQHGEILFNVGNISVANASIIIKDENYASVADLTTSLLSNPLQIVYELATPQTYHLTPSQVKLLKGHNYITTNADTLDLTYQVNNVLGEILSESEEYTDRVFDDLGTASKKDIETTLTNDENLPTGSAVIGYLNSNLYIKTVAIATSIGTYTDNALYTALRNNSDVKNGIPCFFIVEAVGGKRAGICYLYGNTKEYGAIMVMHYYNSPRVFRINDGVITLSSWATT